MQFCVQTVPRHEPLYLAQTWFIGNWKVSILELCWENSLLVFSIFVYDRNNNNNNILKDRGIVFVIPITTPRYGYPYYVGYSLGTYEYKCIYQKNK